MGRICFFPNCVPRNRDFVVFPFRCTLEFENWWRRSGWDELLSTKKLPDRILICEEHFDESLINRRYKIPRLAKGALPSRNIDCPPAKNQQKRKPMHGEVSLHRLFCRLCGEMQATQLDDDGMLLKDLDEILRHLQLSDSILLPMGICTGCREKATMVQQFWKSCNEAQESMRTIFNQEHTVEISTENPTDCFEQPAENSIIKTDYSVPDIETEVDDSSRFDTIEEQPTEEKDESSRFDTIDGPSTEEKEDPAGELEESFPVEYDEVDETSQSDMSDAPGKETRVSEASDTEWFSTAPEPPKEKGKRVEPKPVVDNTVICEICGKVLRSRTAINSHLKSHRDEREHMCVTCGKKFRQRRVLIEHVQSKHEHRIFPCELCGEIYRWQKGLDRHMKIHKGNHLKHSCNLCGKVYPHPHQLKRHMMIHTGDRIYCDICGKGYRFNYMLTQHKIRAHNMTFEGVKLYSKPYPKGRSTRKRIRRKNPEQNIEPDYKVKEDMEIVELDSITIDINPADGSEIGSVTYFEQKEEKHI